MDFKYPLWTVEFTGTAIPTFFNKDGWLLVLHPNNISRADLLTNSTPCTFLFIDVD